MAEDEKRPDPFLEIFSFFLAIVLAIAVLIAANGGYRAGDDALDSEANATLTLY